MKPYKSGFNQKQTNRPQQSDKHRERMLAALARLQNMPTTVKGKSK